MAARHRRRAGSAGIAVLVVVVAVLAPVPSLAAQDVDPSHDRQARSLFDAGREAYGAGEYERALQRFREAYELSGRADLLYNVAQAAERLRRDAEALDAYERFLASEPEPEVRRVVEARIAFLREQLERERADAETGERLERDVAAEPEAMHEPTPPEPADLTAPIAVAIASGLVALGGAVLLGVAIVERDRVESAPDGARWSELEGAAESVGPLSGVGIACLAAGGAGLVGSILWMAIEAGGSARTREQVQLRIGPGGVSIGGAF